MTWRYPPQLPSFFVFEGAPKRISVLWKSIYHEEWERDVLRRTILEILAKGCVHYMDLDKKVCATCHLFATTNTFKSQLHYLLNNSYITRVARGVYQITFKGEKYLTLLKY